MEEKIKMVEKNLAELESAPEQPTKYEPKGLIYVTGKQYLKKGTSLELMDDVDKTLLQYMPKGYIAYLHIVEVTD